MKHQIARLIGCTALAFGADAGQAHHLAQQVHLAGDGSWDYVTVETDARRVFATHGTKVDILDADTLKFVGTLEDTPGPHTALIVSGGRVLVTAGGSDQVLVFDLKTLAKLASIPVAAGPDAMTYEPKTGRAFAFGGKARAFSVVDPAQAKVLATVPLDAKPEFATTDGNGTVFVNLEDANSVARIDAASMKVTARWPLAGCDSPSGLAIDRAHHRLFSVCENKRMVIVDSTTGQKVGDVAIGGGVDAAAFDDARQEAYASGGDGTLTVVLERSPTDFVVKESLRTAAGARTLGLDTRTHRIFLAVADRAPATAAQSGARAPRPPIVPGTFRILTVDP